MARGVAPFRAWFTGRKRFQAATRAALPVFEAVGPRIRINPLARWTTSDQADYMRSHALRENPLVAYGYLSIGCFPCTQPVKPGEDARSGRWAGQAKIECGIHLSGLDRSLDRRLRFRNIVSMTEPTAASRHAPVDAGRLPRGRMDPCRERRGACRQRPLHPAAAGVPRPRPGGREIGQGAARRAAAAGRPLEKIVAAARQLSLVALAFPAFNDGRTFSKAELLRTRHDFEGAVRATGQVLIDQLPHMLRLGFDEFEVSHPVLIARLEAGHTGGIAALLSADRQAGGEGREIFLAPPPCGLNLLAHTHSLTACALPWVGFFLAFHSLQHVAKVVRQF